MPVHSVKEKRLIYRLNNVVSATFSSIVQKYVKKNTGVNINPYARELPHLNEQNIINREIIKEQLIKEHTYVICCLKKAQL
jgi:hypothetical protein